MPLPLILGIAAGIAAAGGVGAGVHGGVKLKKANDTMKSDDKRHKDNVARFEKTNAKATKAMDDLGTLELTILKSFTTFSEIIEQIHNRPEFSEVKINGVTIPKYNPEELEKTSVGAGVLLGGLGGAAAGTAGGFAAAGATTAAVMALGTASTGTAIASLSGAAATNATLAALGGGAIAAGGGGMALGSLVLGGATLGVGLLVGGIIFSVTGSTISSKADKAHNQMLEAEKKINTICTYLNKLIKCADGYMISLGALNEIYTEHLEKLNDIVNVQGKKDWNFFTADEQKTLENTILLVGILFRMCKVQLVLKSEDEEGINEINYEDVAQAKVEANAVLSNPDFVA